MLSASSLTTNILVTVLVILFVVLIPYIDRRLCRKFNINPDRRLDGNDRESRLLRLRETVFYIIFFLYLAVFAYLVFFSRTAAEDYKVHVAPLSDLRASVRIDSGILGVIAAFLSGGVEAAANQVHIEKPEDIGQIYMNIMLFVPMGYLLPYVFNWVQKRVRIRPVLCCFVISLIVENLQLISKRGFYDIDDIIANTFGGLIGQMLYIRLAYIVERPNWKKELAVKRKWKKSARKLTLYPLASKIGTARTTIFCSYEDTVTDFFIGHLGFMLVRKIPGNGDTPCSYLLRIGSFELEIICIAPSNMPEKQKLTMSVKNIVKTGKRLEEKGWNPGEISLDPYTGLRMLSISGPENMEIVFIES